jgi:ERCC4-type nuclease
MSIVLDSRERGLIEIMKETPWQQLPVGDAWIQYDGATKVVVERKTTADLEASFLDGRYREQRTRLLAYCAEHKAKPLYVLEGGLDGRRQRLERSALQKLVHRLLLRYGVAVWSTKDMADTASTLNLLAAQVRDEPTVFEGETLSYTDVQHITKKANKDDPKAFAVAALQGCPGISATAAKALLEAFGSLKGCLEQTPERLSEVKIGQRKLGKVVGSRLAALLQPSSVDP